jgi:hypothetical protein
VSPQLESPPPAAEHVHLPGPSFLPVLTALGVTLALVGLVFSLYVVGLGLLITVIAVVRWVRQTRAEIAELPLGHS